MSSSHNHNNHGHQPRHLEFEPNHGGSRTGSHDQHEGRQHESQYGHRSGDALADQQYDSQPNRRSAGGRNWASGSTGAWVGAAAAVLAGAAAIALTRNKWGAWGSSLSDLASRGSDMLSNVTKGQGGQSADQASGQGSDQTSGQASQASGSGQSSKSTSASKSGSSAKRAGGSSQPDASLNQEVSSKGIKPSPTSGKSFTDEGATGNND